MSGECRFLSSFVAFGFFTCFFTPSHIVPWSLTLVILAYRRVRCWVLHSPYFGCLLRACRFLNIGKNRLELCTPETRTRSPSSCCRLQRSGTTAVTTLQKTMSRSVGPQVRPCSNGYRVCSGLGLVYRRKRAGLCAHLPGCVRWLRLCTIQFSR